MPINNDDIELIDRFIDGTLSEDDADRLSAKRSDPEFRAELEIRQEVAQTIQRISRENLKRDLKSKLGTIDFSERPRSRVLYYAVAAGLALFFVLLWFLPGKESNESLFYSYYVPYPGTINIRGSSEVLASAVKAYEDGRYEQAADQITALLASGHTHSKAHMLLMLGNCYLNLNDASHAEQIFLELQNHQDRIIKQQAQWYLSLTYLKSGQIENCRKLLQDLEQSGGFHASSARNLLDELI